MFLSIFFQKYLTYAPLLLFAFWLYIVYQHWRSVQNIAKHSREGYFGISRLLKSTGNLDPELKKAIAEHRRIGRKYLWLWVLSLLGFTIITLAVGILTADR